MGRAGEGLGGAAKKKYVQVGCRRNKLGNGIVRKRKKERERKKKGYELEAFPMDDEYLIHSMLSGKCK